MVRFSQGSIDFVILAMDTTRTKEREAAQAAVAAAGRVLRDATKRNISLRDHTLADLASMGHPYARRQGTIKIHTSGSKSLKTPSVRVHTQSGKLLAALQDGPGPRAPSYRVWFDVGAAPHAAHVVHGTRVMLPRDVIMDTAEGELTKKNMIKAVITVIGKKLKTKAALRIAV